MFNFYGGPSGQSFTIRHIFSCRYSAHPNSMESDINKAWQSEIPVGSFVMISYGSPDSTLPIDESLILEDSGIDTNQSAYEYFKAIDDKYKPTEQPANPEIGGSSESLNYNATLWEKVYTDVTQPTVNGEGAVEAGSSSIGYKLIATLTGNTPKVELEIGNPLDADQDPLLQIYGPYGAQKDKNPASDEDLEGAIQDKDNPKWILFLPQSQVVAGVTTETRKANLPPEVIWDTGSGPLTNDQGQNVPIRGTINDPRFYFKLPRSQTIGVHEDTIVADPADNPDVDLIDTDIDNPLLQFTLPRAAQFFYGSGILGKKPGDDGVPADAVFTATGGSFAEYGEGDYYIDETTGYVYLVQHKASDTQCDFVFKGKVQNPKPKTTAEAKLNPYTKEGSDYVTRAPIIEVKDVADPASEKTNWNLHFQMPKLPNPKITANFIGATEAGTADVAVTSEEDVTFTLKIPTGSEIFAGTAIREDHKVHNLTGAQPGDMYLNTYEGNLYKLSNDKQTWVLQTGSIKGNSLNIKKAYTFAYQENANQTPQAEIDANLAIAQAAILADFPFNTISPDVLFLVTFTYADGYALSYWFCKPADTTKTDLDKILVTGSSTALFHNSYDTGVSVDQRGYSIQYINGLVDNNGAQSSADATTYKTYSQKEITNRIYALIPDSQSAGATIENKTTFSQKQITTKLNEISSKKYTASLVASGWTSSGSNFIYAYDNTNLRCGKDGDLPPIIQCNSNQTEYNYITSANVTPGEGIEFVASEKPASAINITIIDLV